MNMPDNNPRAVAGDNSPEAYGLKVAADLARQYRETEESVSAALEEARALPKEVKDEATVALYVPVMQKLRDLNKVLDAYHEAEKGPHQAAGRAVDGFFFGFMDKLKRRSKTGNGGAIDVLQSRIDAYAQEVLRQEHARRIAEEQRLRREADERAEAARLAEAEAERLRQEAERARKPETIAAKTAQADKADQVAAEAAGAAANASDQHQEARVSAFAKPAEMVRQRVGTGGMMTAGSEKYADVLDESLLDKNALWPYISFEEKSKALRAWAKSTGHKQQMTGAAIGERAKGRVL